MKREASIKALTKWILASLAIFVAVSIAAVPSLRWRAELTLLFAVGKIPDIAFQDFVALISPNSGQSLTRMIETRNPHTVIHNLRSTLQDIEVGGHAYAVKCVSCHGVDGKGSGRAPSLVGRTYKVGQSDWAVYQTIRYGVSGSIMPAHPLPTSEIWQIASYVKSLDIANSQDAQAQNTADKPKFVPVNASEIPVGANANGDWLTYSGSYSGTRHSSLLQINPSNVSTLGVKWLKQFVNETGIIQSSPIVRGQFMFITLPSGRVMALNANDGSTLWAYDTKSAGTNRGVAILDDKIYVGTTDAKLIALSAQTGALLWEKTIADKNMYLITSAPLVRRSLVVTGVATNGGGRGFIAALDAKAGEEKWRFTTIPGVGEKGNDTWAGDSWKEGGAPTWLTGSYDESADILYWGVGNPKPDYNAAARKGDNLYSDSVLALRGNSGKLL